MLEEGMEERLDDSDSFGLDLLEQRIEQIVGQLTDCRKQNEMLQAEITSLQSILRSCKLPVSGSGHGSSDNGFSYEEKVQIRQKLVLILQRIEVELRNEMPG